MCGWLEEHGINPHDVPEDFDMSLRFEDSEAYLRCEVFARDSEGQFYVDHHSNEAARTHVEVPLRSQPPTSWT